MAVNVDFMNCSEMIIGFYRISLKMCMGMMVNAYKSTCCTYVRHGIAGEKVPYGLWTYNVADSVVLRSLINLELPVILSQ